MRSAPGLLLQLTRQLLANWGVCAAAPCVVPPGFKFMSAVQWPLVHHLLLCSLRCIPAVGTVGSGCLRLKCMASAGFRSLSALPHPKVSPSTQVLKHGLQAFSNTPTAALPLLKLR